MKAGEPGAYERLEEFANAARFYIEAFEKHTREPGRYTLTNMMDARTRYEVAMRALNYKDPQGQEWDENWG